MVSPNRHFSVISGNGNVVGGAMKKWRDMPFGNISSVPYGPWTPTAISKDTDSHLRLTRLSREKHICINSSGLLQCSCLELSSASLHFLWCVARFCSPTTISVQFSSPLKRTGRLANLEIALQTESFKSSYELSLFFSILPSLRKVTETFLN